MPHADVFDIFLSVFDNGRITGNRGQVVDCSNALFILTSNLALGEGIGFVGQALDLRARLARFLRPELVNRLTDVVQFEPLVDLIFTGQASQGELVAIEQNGKIGFSPNKNPQQGHLISYPDCEQSLCDE